MSLTTRVGLLAGASALTLTGASFADNPTEAQNYEARIAELEATVAQLKGDNWLTDQRAEEIRGLVQDVLADADTRASLLQAGMTAGYDNGFVIGSSDGNFSLKLNGQLQTRFLYNNQDNGPGDDDRWGFENTRTKLMFSGNVVNPDWMYYIEADFMETGTFTLDDAYIAYNFGNGWTAMMGQFKAPVLREELVHSMYQLAVERSWLNEYFTGGRTQGIAVDYRGDQFHFIASYNDGANMPNTPWNARDTEFSMTGRVEILFQGTWDQFRDFTSWKGEETGFMLGGALHYQNEEYGTVVDVNEMEAILATIDASLEFGGANLFGAFIYRSLDDNATITSDQFGFLVQGGFFLNEDWELFGRYEYADLDMEGVDNASIFTLGVNRYWAKHGLKWTTDLGFGIDSVPTTQSITGWRADSLAEDGQIVLRTQLQLTF
jgi:hypothetical protein